MTDTRDADPVALAREWLERQRARPRYLPPVKYGAHVKGTCRTCGALPNSPHEPTDPCGIVAGLLVEIERLREKVDEANGDMRSAAQDAGDLAQALWSRVNQGDIPWDAGNDIAAEFCGLLRELEKRLNQRAEALLRGRR